MIDVTPKKPSKKSRKETTLAIVFLLFSTGIIIRILIDYADNSVVLNLVAFIGLVVHLFVLIKLAKERSQKSKEGVAR